jgi:hypothetical protein
MMEFLKVGFLFLLLQYFAYQAVGQNTALKTYTYNIKYHNGFVVNHSKNMAHLANQRPQGVEFDMFKITNGSKSWHRIHKYPVVGYSFQYFHMDQKKPLGNSYSMVIYLGKRLITSKKSLLYYRLGCGVAYIDKRFDLQSNYKNNLISSRFNYALNGRFNYTYQINNRWNVNAGIGIIHFSNGATKVPNLGINIPTFHLGIGFTPSKEEKIKRDSLPPFHKELNFNITLTGGFKQVYPVGGRTYFASSYSSYFNKRVSRKSGLTLGADVMFDGSNKTVLDTSQSAKKIKYFKVGATIGHEFYINKLSLLTQFGVYLYDPLRLDKRHYQRIALKYYFSKSLYASVGLKTHLGSADYTEWGLGIKL